MGFLSGVRVGWLYQPTSVETLVVLEVDVCIERELVTEFIQSRRVSLENVVHVKTLVQVLGVIGEFAHPDMVDLLELHSG